MFRLTPKFPTIKASSLHWLAVLVMQPQNDNISSTLDQCSASVTYENQCRPRYYSILLHITFSIVYLFHNLFTRLQKMVIDKDIN